MDEVEGIAVAKRAEVTVEANGLDRFPERDQAVEPEDRVVKVAFPGAVFEAAIGILLPADKLPDEFGRLTQQVRREPGGLQHFEFHAHGTSP